jgi:3-oxoacyl-[acyl-carrier-protein] synthase I
MSSSVAVTGLGLTTSVGFGVGPACAAIRANIVRPAPLVPPVAAFDTSSNEAHPVFGHPIRGLTDGFQGVGRLKRLALSALSDLRSQLPEGEWPRLLTQSRLYLCLANDLETRMQLDTSDMTEFVESLGSTLGMTPLTLLTSGPASVIEAIRLASEEFDRHSIERAIVIGVDSYLDQESVDWLVEQRRLKTLERPAALMPGEAGACLSIVPYTPGDHKELKLLATIDMADCQPCAATDPPHLGIAKALSELLIGTLTRPAGDRTLDVVVNLNGEQRLANAWGSSLLEIAMAVPQWGFRPVTPLAHLGEVGAAFGAVGICLAAHSFGRHYAKNAEVLVAAIPFEGKAGACRVIAPEP